MRKNKKIRCSIGIMAYNEEKNIGKLLKRVQDQVLDKVVIDEIFVIASGCTDKTENIVKKFVKKNFNLKLIKQKKRLGKAAAVNLFLKKAKDNILVLLSADLLPKKDAIEKLVAPFSHPALGMSGARAIPTNNKNTFMGFTAHLFWDLCHHLSLKHPKMGEMIAFRKIFKRIPYSSAVDEANIEPLVVGQEYNIKYIPESIVFNKGSENLIDFFHQRRRIFCGHLTIRKKQGYTVSTFNGLRLFLIYLKIMRFNFKYLFWSAGVILLEAYGRFLGLYDFLKGKKHTVWKIAKSTKKLTI